MFHSLNNSFISISNYLLHTFYTFLFWFFLIYNVHMYVYICLCVSAHRCRCMCIWMFGGLGFMSGIILSHSSALLIEEWVNRTLRSSTQSRASQLALETPSWAGIIGGSSWHRFLGIPTLIKLSQQILNFGALPPAHIPSTLYWSITREWVSVLTEELVDDLGIMYTIIYIMLNAVDQLPCLFQGLHFPINATTSEILGG